MARLCLGRFRGVTAKRYSCCHQVIFILVVFVAIQFFLYQSKKQSITSNNVVSNQLNSLGITSHPRSLNETLPSNTSSEVHPKTKTADSGPDEGPSMKDTFEQGKWNSSFISKFHRHFDVNCAAIIRGEKEAVAKASTVLKQNSHKIPDDNAVKGWVKDCTQYRIDRRYPTIPRSKEEEEYPIAYIITTHTDSSQFERLLRAVYQPQHVYCIHPDAKSPAPFQEAIRSLAACFPNVFVVSQAVKVYYAHSSRLQADINCMADLLKRLEPWKYVINLCAQDFPLKTNLEIIHQLKAFEGHNDIQGITAPDWFDHRIVVHHEFRNGIMVKLPDVHKPPPPRNFTLFFGNAYYAATREFVHYVINDQTAIDLLHYSEDTYSPDEHYWVTLHRIPGVPGGSTVSSWNSTIRFVHWKGTKNSPECVGKYVRNICVFGAGYVKHISKDNRLFANKFHMSDDPIAIQCMEELLDYRSSYPPSTADFLKDFPRPAKTLFGLKPGES